MCSFCSGYASHMPCKQTIGRPVLTGRRLPNLIRNDRAPYLQLYDRHLWWKFYGRSVVASSCAAPCHTDSPAGYSVREELPLPDKPPYTVHLGNLSFDATVGDVTDFFAGCECTNVRIIEDKLEMKPKGFGYAEFATLDGLKQALTLNGSQFQGRNIRISVADPRMWTCSSTLAPTNVRL